MTLPDLPAQGSCRCGQVRFEVTARPLMTAACHCRGCQKMTASAFSLTAILPAEGLAILSGATERGGAKSPELDHQCCPNCKSWIFTRIAGIDEIVNLRATLLDDVAWFRPYIETWTSEKLGWVNVPAEESFEGFPPREDLPRLMSAFSSRA